MYIIRERDTVRDKIFNFCDTSCIILGTRVLCGQEHFLCFSLFSFCYTVREIILSCVSLCVSMSNILSDTSVSLLVVVECFSYFTLPVLSSLFVFLQKSRNNNYLYWWSWTFNYCYPFPQLNHPLPSIITFQFRIWSVHN